MKGILFTVCVLLLPFSSSALADSYVRYAFQNHVKYGLVKGDSIQPLKGSIFDDNIPDGEVVNRSQVKILLPTVPEKVFAVGMNFASHISSDYDSPPPLFLKLPSSLIATGESIVFPNDASNVHFEGELVLVIGKELKGASEADASDAIFGVLAGNDLTERNWQGQDLQWMRAKASDGFGPISGEIVTGVDYNNVVLTTRLNGEIVQQESTKNMIHKPAKVVSYLSHYFTLKPGDLVFMGTPGRTKALRKGDVVSVAIEGVGKVVNKVE
ncbi:fumarylacetoacetate hydrolase family protein [Photobacterium sp. DNB23_23_1]